MSASLYSFSVMHTHFLFWDVYDPATLWSAQKIGNRLKSSDKWGASYLWSPKKAKYYISSCACACVVIHSNGIKLLLAVEGPLNMLRTPRPLEISQLCQGSRYL